MTKVHRRCPVIFLTMISTIWWSCRALAEESPSLAELSLEQLSDIEIVSVSKRMGSVLDAPASVYVISHDSIRRSGATSIPEALRLAPSVEVARRGSHEWSVSIRGFNNSISNKLLVLIDGRSVYSPLYAGVFWDVQDTLLEDVDRIEVISGPGGALWGANAVNGVINIITRSATETEGGFAETGGGNEERMFAGFRYGGHIAQDTAMRAYIKTFERDSAKDTAGRNANDDWRMVQGGFRLDWEPPGDDHLTFQGDVYSGEEGGRFESDFALGGLPGDEFRDEVEVSGGNLLGRWSREKAAGDQWRWQVYYDHTRRHIPATGREVRHTLDMEFQYNYALIDDHNFLWGAGFNLTEDHIDNSLTTAFQPDSRTDQTLSAFFQDRLTLKDEKVFLTVGSKFEHNDYTGFEVQPNLRLSWLASREQTLWTAISRAIRIPSRLDSDVQLTRLIAAPDNSSPIYATYSGNPNSRSEKLIAYEAGYRIQVKDTLSFDVALFYNDYDSLQTFEPEAPIVVNETPGYTLMPYVIGNEMEGHSYGGVLVTKWQPMPNWRLEFHHSALRLQLHAGANSGDNMSEVLPDNSPENQSAVHSFVNLPNNLSLYGGLRYVGRLPNQQVSGYTAFDMTLQWQARENISVSLTGKNLTDSGHLEFGSADMNEIERSLYGRVKWKF